MPPTVTWPPLMDAVWTSQKSYSIGPPAAPSSTTVMWRSGMLAGAYPAPTGTGIVTWAAGQSPVLLDGSTLGSQSNSTGGAAALAPLT
jgi:hypothetical protein